MRVAQAQDATAGSLQFYATTTGARQQKTERTLPTRDRACYRRSSAGCWFVRKSENVSHALIPWSFPRTWWSLAGVQTLGLLPHVSSDEVSRELFCQTLNRKQTVSVDLRWAATLLSPPEPPLLYFLSACLFEQGAPPVVAEAISTRTATLAKLVPRVRVAWTTDEEAEPLCTTWTLSIVAADMDALHTHLSEQLLAPLSASSGATTPTPIAAQKRPASAAEAEDKMLLVLLDLFGGDSSAVDAAALCTQVAKGIVLVSSLDVAPAGFDDLDVALQVASALDVPFGAIQLLLAWWKRATSASTRSGWRDFAWLSWLVLVERYANLAEKTGSKQSLARGGTAVGRGTRFSRCVCFGPEGLEPISLQQRALEVAEDELESVLQAWGDVLRTSTRVVWWEALTDWNRRRSENPVIAAALLRSCVDRRGPRLPFEQVIVCVLVADALDNDEDAVQMPRLDGTDARRRGSGAHEPTMREDLCAHGDSDARDDEGITNPPWKVLLTPVSAVRRLNSALSLLVRSPEHQWRVAATALDDDELSSTTSPPVSLTTSTIWRHRTQCSLASHVKLLLIRVGWYFVESGCLADVAQIASTQLQQRGRPDVPAARCVEAVLVADSGLLCVLDPEAYGWLCVVERVARSIVHAPVVQAFLRARLSAGRRAQFDRRRLARCVVTVQAFARSRDSMRRTMLKDCFSAIESAWDRDRNGEGVTALTGRIGGGGGGGDDEGADSLSPLRIIARPSASEWSAVPSGRFAGPRTSSNEWFPGLVPRGVGSMTTTGGGHLALAQDQLCRLEQRYRAWVVADEHQTRRNTVEYVFQSQFPLGAFLAHEHEQRHTLEVENLWARGDITVLQEAALRERVHSLERRARWRWEVATAGVRLPLLLASESHLRNVLESNALAGIKELRDVLEVTKEVLQLRHDMGPASGARQDSLSRASPSTASAWPLSLVPKDALVGPREAEAFAVAPRANGDGGSTGSSPVVAVGGGTRRARLLDRMLAVAARSSHSRPPDPIGSNGSMRELAGSTASLSALAKPLHEMQRERLVEAFLAEMAVVVMAEREERAKIALGTAAALFACREAVDRHTVHRQWLFGLSRLRCTMERDRFEVLERLERSFLWATQNLVMRELERRWRGIARKELDMRLMIHSVATSERSHLQSTAALWESVCRDEYTSPTALLSKLERERNEVQRCLATLAADDRAQRKALRDRLRHTTTSDARTLSPSMRSLRAPRR